MIFGKVECPYCHTNITIFRMKNEFMCPDCKTILICRNWLKMNLIAFVVSEIVLFLLLLLPISTSLYVLFSVFVFIVMMRIYAGNADIAVLRINK